MLVYVMVNCLWCVMIVAGVIYSIFTGNVDKVSNGIVETSKDAVNLCISMTGVICMWTGLMESAENSGAAGGMMRVIEPLIRFLFPDIPKDHKSRKYISTNIVANILGLGWAATPAGLSAMSELKNLEKERGSDLNCASNEMCTFMVLNMSSLQLIPVNMIAYRSQYGSANPSDIIFPTIIATSVSTAVAIIFCRIMQRMKGK